MSVTELQAAIAAAIAGAQGIDAQYVAEALQNASSFLDAHIERLAQGG